MSRHLRDEGSMTVHALTIISILSLLTALAIAIVITYGLGQQAAQAADLAALAASRASVEGDDPCTTGRAITEANDASMVDCQMDADVATITARAEISGWFGRWGMERKARAAPDFYFHDSHDSPQ